LTLCTKRRDYGILGDDVERGGEGSRRIPVGIWGGREEGMVFPSFGEFKEIIRRLSSWAADVDGICNYFIRSITSLHSPLYNAIRRKCQPLILFLLNKYPYAIKC
jgi:hypothetical protein